MARIPDHDHDLHVVPNPIVGWRIVAPDHPRPLAVTRTRDEAVALALRMEYEDPDSGEVLIYAPDGTISERRHADRADLFPNRTPPE